MALLIDGNVITQPTTKKHTTPVSGSDRRLYLMNSHTSEGKEALNQFDSALNTQATRNAAAGGSPTAIRETQSQLTALGYDTGGVDGFAGAKTDQAIRDFQKAHGLTVDGIIGPKTRAALDAANSLTRQQTEIDALATASPSAAQAMQAQLQADVTAAEARIEQIDQDIDLLGTTSSSVTGALGTEQKILETQLRQYHLPQDAALAADLEANIQTELDESATSTGFAWQLMTGIEEGGSPEGTAVPPDWIIGPDFPGLSSEGPSTGPTPFSPIISLGPGGGATYVPPFPGSEILGNPPVDQGPDVLGTPPAPPWPGILGNPPIDQGPEILGTPPGLLGEGDGTLPGGNWSPFPWDIDGRQTGGGHPLGIDPPGRTIDANSDGENVDEPGETGIVEGEQQKEKKPPKLKPLDKGAEEWARRHPEEGLTPKEARDRAHEIKQDSDIKSGGRSDFRVDPKSGDVYDPEGEIVGNLNQSQN